ncbi:glycosyltransferase family 39 protein [candidate division WOR-3 bacterium]|nr:glycosyltransferase family 39 protein [candidate division WOR-3 bacterium]
MNRGAKWLWTLVLVGFGIRLAVMIGLETYRFDDDFSFGFEAGRIARSMVLGQGFSSPFYGPTGPTAILPPVFPALLALIFSQFGVYTVASAAVFVTLNSGISALTCIPLFYLTRRVFDVPTAWLSTSAFALHPSAIWYSVNMVWDTTLFTLMAVCLLLGLYSMRDSFTWKSAVWFGLGMGIATLTKTLILTLLPVAGFWLWLRAAGPKKETVLRLGLTCACILAVLLPWTMRNFLVLGKPVLRSNLGLELNIGNNDYVWTSLISEDVSDRILYRSPLYHPTNKDQERKLAEMGEIAYMRWSEEHALAYIRTHPTRFLRLTAARIFGLWLGPLGRANEWNNQVRVGFSLAGIKAALMVLPLPFAAVGIYLAARSKKEIFPLLGFLTLGPGVYYLTHVAPRYRFPFDPILLMLGAFAVRMAIARYRRRAAAVAA